MRDPRVDGLANAIVNYSLELKEGQTFLISSGIAAEPLVQALYEKTLEAGANPMLDLSFEGTQEAFFRLASDEQLEWISPTQEWAFKNADARMRILSDTNTRELSNVPPEKQTRRQKAMHPLMTQMMERSAAGDLRWNVTLFPTNAYASAASMSLRDFEDFYYRACLADQPDPVTAWIKASENTNRLAEWIEGHEEVHIQGPGTDLKLNVAGRHFVPADGKYNMPDGEFFTGPHEDSAEGEITFHLPASYSGREVAGVRFRFEGGKVVDATAERGEDFLIEVLDTDEGARQPRRARDRHELRHHRWDRGDPARREDRRHRPPRGRPELPGDRWRQRVSGPLGHDLRPAQGRLDHRRRRGAPAGRGVRRLEPGFALGSAHVGAVDGEGEAAGGCPAAAAERSRQDGRCHRSDPGGHRGPGARGVRRDHPRPEHQRCRRGKPARRGCVSFGPGAGHGHLRAVGDGHDHLGHSDPVLRSDSG